jgi:hypothetical protein
VAGHGFLPRRAKGCWKRMVVNESTR